MTALVVLTPPFAHAGHVLIDLLTFIPVLVLLLWFVVAAVRDRRREGSEDDGPT